MVEILLDLESCSVTLVLGRKQISEDIWVSIQFYTLLLYWSFLIAICPFSLTPAWNCACQYIRTKGNGTTMWGLGLEEIILVSLVKYTGDSTTVSSRRCPRVFIQLGLKFTSDKEDFLVEIYIFLSLVLLGHV